MTERVIRVTLDPAGVGTGARVVHVELQGIERHATMATGGFASLRRMAMGAFAIGGVTALGGAVKAILDRTLEAERATGQLHAVLVSTGKASQITAGAVEGLAEQLSRTTTFGENAAKAASALLLQYDAIGEDVFPRAMRAAADLAARMGGDLSSAAQRLGLALDRVAQGETNVELAGLKLSDMQKRLIEQYTLAGDTAGAMNVVLEQTEKQFAGAAAAARDNFGGALTGVKHAMDELIAVDGGVPGLTRNLNELEDTLREPALKNAVQGIFEAFVTGTTVSAKFFTHWFALQRMSWNLLTADIEEAGRAWDDFLGKQQGLGAGGDFRGRGASGSWADNRESGGIPEIAVFSAGRMSFAEQLRYDEQRERELQRYAEGLEEFVPFPHRLLGEERGGRGFAGATAISAEGLENTRFDQFGEALLANTQHIAEQMGEIFKKPFDSLEPYAEQAARNMQTAFAQFLFDPFDQGVKGMLKGFVDTLRQMMAEAAAARILSGVSGFLGSFLGGLFGAGLAPAAGGGGSSGVSGPRAMGGEVLAGGSYLVGERGRELFVPREAGYIVPNHHLGSAATKVLNVSVRTGDTHIDARGATQEGASELARRLPRLLRERDENLKHEIAEAIRSGEIEI